MTQHKVFGSQVLPATHTYATLACTSQPKLVLLNRLRKDGSLSWPRHCRKRCIVHAQDCITKWKCYNRVMGNLRIKPRFFGSAQPLGRHATCGTKRLVWELQHCTMLVAGVNEHAIGLVISCRQADGLVWELQHCSVLVTYISRDTGILMSGWLGSLYG